MRSSAFLIPALLVTLTIGCGPRGGRGASGGESIGSASDDGRTKTVTRTRTTPTGTVTETTTVTTETVEAPDPPDRGEDPLPGDVLVRYNLERLNWYRKNAGRQPLKYDAKISAFALEASLQLAKDHKPHAHFREKAGDSPALGSRSAENQGDWNGVPQLAKDPIENGKKQIDVMLDLMFKEGPGGGHYENMLNPRFKRVGIGLHTVGGKLYMTNDFSN